MNLKWILGYRKLMTLMLLLSMLLWTISLATAQNDSEVSVVAYYKDIQAIVYDKVRGIYGKDYFYNWQTNEFTTYSTTPTPLSQIDIRNNIVLDGELNEDAWKEINPVTINLEPTHPWGGAIKSVSLRALNNGTWLFLALQWEDSTESREEMPRIKRPEGGFFHNSTYFYSDNLVIGWWMKEGKPTVKPWFSVHYAGSTMGLVPWKKDDPTAKASLWIFKAYFTDDESKHWPKNYFPTLRTFKWGRFEGQPNDAPYPHLVETMLNATANYAVSMISHVTGCAFPGEDMYSWDVRGNGKWRDGVWTLEVARPFEPHPLNQRFNATMWFESGKIYYFFLAASDGHHGENNEVGSISGWFTLYIEPPSPIINWPLGFLVAAATGVIGIIAAWSVWRRNVRKKIALGKVHDKVSSAVLSSILILTFLLSTAPILSGGLAETLGESCPCRIDNSTNPIEENWVMLGGGPERNFYYPRTISPPLEIKWKYTYGGVRKTFYIGSSPAVYGKYVIVGGGDGVLRALNADDGTTLWTFQTQGPIRSSPTIFEGRVFVGSDDGYVYALDMITGEMIWRFKTGDKVWSSPAISEGILYIGSHDGYLYAIDAVGGSLKWRFKTGGPIISSPTIVGEKVYFGSDDGYLYALKASTGELVWKTFLHNSVWSSPSYSNGKIYAGSLSWDIFAVDAESGAILWRNSADWYIKSSVAVSNDIIYTGSVDGYVYALNATSGRILWEFETKRGIHAAPVVIGDLVYAVSTDGFLYILDARSGKLIWKYDAGEEIFSSPAVSEGTIYIHSGDNTIHALRAVPPERKSPQFIDSQSLETAASDVNVGTEKGKEQRNEVSPPWYDYSVGLALVGAISAALFVALVMRKRWRLQSRRHRLLQL